MEEDVLVAVGVLQLSNVSLTSRAPLRFAICDLCQSDVRFPRSSLGFKLSQVLSRSRAPRPRSTAVKALNCGEKGSSGFDVWRIAMNAKVINNLSTSMLYCCCCRCYFLT